MPWKAVIRRSHANQGTQISLWANYTLGSLSNKVVKGPWTALDFKCCSRWTIGTLRANVTHDVICRIANTGSLHADVTGLTLSEI
jgi:hypothetical protein